MNRRKKMAGSAVKAILCLAVMGLFAAASNAGEIKIVSIDTGRVLEAHPAFQEAMGKFRGQIEEMQKRIGEMDEEQQMMAQQMMQQQLQQMGMQLQEEAFGKMQQDVRKLAGEKGYDYVLDSNMLIAGGQDITEEVLESFKKLAPPEEPRTEDE